LRSTGADVTALVEISWDSSTKIEPSSGKLFPLIEKFLPAFRADSVKFPGLSHTDVPRSQEVILLFPALFILFLFLCSSLFFAVADLLFVATTSRSRTFR
jgi:hypothetical protein